MEGGGARRGHTRYRNTGLYNVYGLKSFSFVTLRAKLSGAVYCYWSCLWRACDVCSCVCGSVTTIIWNCVHWSSPNWVCSRAKVFGTTLLASVQCLRLSERFFSLFTSGTSQLTINAEDQSRQLDYGEGKWYKFLGEKYILANIIAFLYSVKRRPNNIRT